MDDRQAQARDEAERRFPRPIVTPHRQVGRRDVFMEAVDWADANPQPTTITQGALSHAAWMLQNLPEDKIAAMLPGLVGIEVVADAAD